MNTSSSHTLIPLRSILLMVMLSILLLPIGAVYFFRIYENELVRQTEQELIAQSAALAATWRQLLRMDANRPDQTAETGANNGTLTPVFPMLDLHAPLAPPRPDAIVTNATSPDPQLARTARNMAKIMTDTQQTSLAGMRLLDAYGTVLAGREEVGMSLAHIPEVRQALEGQYASIIRERIAVEPQPPVHSDSRGTNIRIFTAFPVLEDGRQIGVIYLSRTPTNIMTRLYEIRQEVSLVAVALLALTLVLGILVSAAIARPIRALLRQIELVRQNEQRAIEPISRPIIREVAQLSASFTSMSQSLAERNEYIRKFATHVSHEFKTPLSAMQGALELLLDHLETMEPERTRQFLHNLISDTQRMKLLVSRLLELAKADAMTPSAKRSRLKATVQSVQSAFWDRELRLTLDGDDMELPIAPEGLEIVLNNLAENSLHHGATCVTITGTYASGQCRLHIQDNGHGISAANRDKIFTPFFTTRRSTGGTGLGLEICRSVLKAYGGSMELETLQPNVGAAFVIRLAQTE